MGQESKEKLIKEIYDEIYLELYLFLSRFTNSIQDIEDVIQNVFLKLLMSPEAFTAIKNPRSYIFLMCRNSMLNLLRDQKRINLKEIPEDWDIEDNQKIDLEELIHEVSRAIDSLPSQCKVIFLMAKREGKKYKEISEILGISVKTVENQMGIAFRKIREIVNQSRKLPLDPKILSLAIILCLSQMIKL